MKKKCKDCQKLKLLSDFYTHLGMGDGHLNKCIECVKRRITAWRGDNLERVRAYDRLRGRTEERKAINRERGKKRSREYAHLKKEWQKRNSHKRQAHIKVGSALRVGTLKKPKRCFDCKKRCERLHGHHDDYSKPLEVIWLCVSCHAKRHRKYEDD